MRFFLIIAVIAAMGAPAAMADEIPAYTVDEKDGNIEVRTYPPMIMAEVTVTGDRDEASGKGFQILASFIFGQNTTRDEIAMTAPVEQRPVSEKIAMTAPVEQRPAGSDEWVVAFIMPAKYTMETLPKPIDNRITIRQTESYRLAAIRFSGTYREANWRKHQDKLMAWVSARGFESEGTPYLAFYNAPMTPPPLRRNEVMVRLVD